jgi:hypothetical protein
VYGQEGASALGGGSPQVVAVAAGVAGTATPQATYPQEPENRILIRVLAPHIDPPMEAWFDRSAGKGTITGIPPGDRIAVEVDEFDNTATSLFTNAPLLGRGWTHGLTLAPGEHKQVTITMHDKGTIIQACGNPPSSSAGMAGDTGDGGLAVNASLGQPVAIKAGPDDSLYVSSAQYSRIRRIDRYGYIWHFAGNGQTGTLTDGQAALDAPIGFIFDIDIDSMGNLYLITLDQRIVFIDSQSMNISLKYDEQQGIYNYNMRTSLSIAYDNSIFYTNEIDNNVYRVINKIREKYVMDNTPHQSHEGADRNYYPLKNPSDISYSKQTNSIIFCDKENNKIKKLDLMFDNVYTQIGSPIYVPYFDGMDPSSMTPINPYIVEYDMKTGLLFFSEKNSNNIKYLNYYGKIWIFAGSDIAGFSGDGGPATSARLNNPGAVTVDSRGNVYIADTGNHAIRMVVGGALP